ncbi:MAG: hypothetical protein IT470_04340 [Pseudomonadales bacterium]|nr:hypothetical protein [Pseudomonadales bacterium]
MSKRNLYTALLAVSMLLAGCVAKTADEKPAFENVALSFSATSGQYMCVSPVYLSDVTKNFSMPLGDKQHTVALGSLLNQAVQKMFWKEAKAEAVGKAIPVVMVGFDGGTGAYRDDTLYTRVSLQFQIFRPTGQSYMDVVVGEASSKTVSNASDAAVVNAALEQALGRLAGVLVSAGICRSLQ